MQWFTYCTYYSNIRLLEYHLTFVITNTWCEMKPRERLAQNVEHSVLLLFVLLLLLIDVPLVTLL
jgi:hypothetical protein